MPTYLKLLLVAALLSPAALQAAPGNPDSLLEHRLFFQLRSELQAGAYNRLPAWRKLYFQAFTDNAFHRSRASNGAIRALLLSYRKNLDDKSIARLLLKKIDNHIKQYEYSQAYEATQLLLSRYSAALEADEVEDLNNAGNIWKGLLHTGAQTTTIGADTRIAYTRDLAGLINIPVRFADSSYDFVFDTGANLSVISETYARKTRLRLLNAYFNVRAITGIQVKANLGVAEAFHIGDVTVRNAVFIVFPDSALSFANGAYKINAIIGFPVIEQLKEIHIHRDKFMTIPKTAVDTPLRNLALDELLPVIDINYGGDMLAFTFDTGAQQTFFNKPFYDRYKTMIDTAGKAFNMQFGGAGGNTSARSYSLAGIDLTIGGRPATLQKVAVKTVANTPKDTYYYGNLGQDVMRQFKEMVINFRYMYVRFNP